MLYCSFSHSLQRIIYTTKRRENKGMRTAVGKDEHGGGDGAAETILNYFVFKSNYSNEDEALIGGCSGPERRIASLRVYVCTSCVPME